MAKIRCAKILNVKFFLSTVNSDNLYSTKSTAPYANTNNALRNDTKLSPSHFPGITSMGTKDNGHTLHISSDAVRMQDGIAHTVDREIFIMKKVSLITFNDEN